MTLQYCCARSIDPFRSLLNRLVENCKEYNIAYNIVVAVYGQLKIRDKKLDPLNSIENVMT